MVGLLVGSTTGWTDESSDVYVAEFAQLESPTALFAAVRKIAQTWTEARRPPLGVVLSAYRSEREREQQDSVSLPSGQAVVDFDRGMSIAWEAAKTEAAKHGREPNRLLFEKWLGDEKKNQRRA